MSQYCIANLEKKSSVVLHSRIVNRLWYHIKKLITLKFKYWKVNQDNVDKTYHPTIDQQKQKLPSNLIIIQMMNSTLTLQILEWANYLRRLIN